MDAGRSGDDAVRRLDEDGAQGGGFACDGDGNGEDFQPRVLSDQEERIIRAIGFAQPLGSSQEGEFRQSHSADRDFAAFCVGEIEDPRLLFGQLTWIADPKY